MKIGVIGDTHGDLVSWEKVREEYFRDADLIIHSGDILYHGPRNPMSAGYNPAGLASSMNNCDIPILVAQGNCDADVDQLALDIPIQSPYMFLQFQELRILAHHGHELPRQRMVELGKRYKVNYFIFGHIHTPVLEKHNSLILLNPGSPSLSKFQTSGKIVYTAAIITPEGAKIFDIDSGETLCEESI